MRKYQGLSKAYNDCTDNVYLKENYPNLSDAQLFTLELEIAMLAIDQRMEGSKKQAKKLKDKLLLIAGLLPSPRKIEPRSKALQRMIEKLYENE